MNDRFGSPNDFLEYLQDTMKSEWRDVQDEQFQAMAAEWISKSTYGASFWEKWSDNPLGLVVGDLSAQIFECLPADKGKLVHDSVAIGPLFSGNVNATIIRSMDDKYAVLINEGLMILIHKVLKLYSAMKRPDLVTYLPSGQPITLTSHNLRHMLSELFRTYRDSGLPSGALIGIDESLEWSYGIMRTLAQLFVLSHEIGHFLNGDLADRDAFLPFMGRKDLRRFRENVSHRAELDADITGFEIVLNCTRKWHNDIDEQRTQDFHQLSFLSVIQLFDIPGAIGAGEDSTSHPSVVTRVVNLAGHFFGDDAAKKWERSYESIFCADADN